SNLGVRWLEQETAFGVYLRRIDMSRITFGLILHNGSSEHAGPKPFVDTCLHDDFRFYGTDDGIPPEPSAVASHLVGSEPLLTRQCQPAHVGCEPFVLLQLLEVARDRRAGRPRHKRNEPLEVRLVEYGEVIGEIRRFLRASEPIQYVLELRLTVPQRQL